MVKFGVASALEKLRPDGALPTARSIDLAAARGECESAQIAVRAGRPIAGLSARAAPLQGASPIVPALYRVATLDLSRPSGPDGASGAWPDPLIPERDAFFGEPRRAFPVEVPAGRVQSIWVEVCVPLEAPPGLRRGAVLLADGRAQLAAVPIALEVWPFALPATIARPVTFGLPTRVGTRALGMGGAFVGVADDATAVYWNPAGLAMVKSVDIRIQGTAEVTARSGLASALHDLDDFNPNDTSAANQARAQGIANQINQPGATISGVGTGGLYVKGHLGEHAFGFNVSDVFTSGGFVTSPVQVTTAGGRVNVTGQMALQGLEARQAAFSYAYAFADKTFAIGVTAKLIQGAAYTSTANLEGGQDPNLLDNLGKAKISTSYGIDVGAIYRPSSWLRFGVIGKDLNQPTFDAPNGSEFMTGSCTFRIRA